MWERICVCCLWRDNDGAQRVQIGDDRLLRIAERHLHIALKVSTCIAAICGGGIRHGRTERCRECTLSKEKFHPGIVADPVEAHCRGSIAQLNTSRDELWKSQHNH